MSALCVVQGWKCVEPTNESEKKDARVHFCSSEYFIGLQTTIDSLYFLMTKTNNSIAT